jgi:hypothetical protein
VLLDEVVLEQQRLALGAGHRHLDVRDLADHHHQAAVQRPAEVARHPALQVLGLADVEHRALRVQHAVDAGLEGICLRAARWSKDTEREVRSWK